MGRKRKITFDSPSDAQMKRKYIISWIIWSVLIFITMAFTLKVVTILIETYNEAAIDMTDIDGTQEICKGVTDKTLRFHTFCERVKKEQPNTPGMKAVGITYDRVYYGILGTIYTILRSTWTIVIVAIMSVLFGAYGNHRGWLKLASIKNKANLMSDGGFNTCGMSDDSYAWMTNGSVSLNPFSSGYGHHTANISIPEGGKSLQEYNNNYENNVINQKID